MVTSGKIIDRVSDTNWYLYVLELEKDKYYVGIATDPVKRFEQHKAQRKDASNWCKSYKPIKIIGISDTRTKRMQEAIYKEDLKTLTYIKKYGAQNVRGGRYSGADSKVEKKSEAHLKRGYITLMHFLCAECGITISELEKRKIFRPIKGINHKEEIEKFILDTRKTSLVKEDVLNRIESILDNEKI